ncbi:MAG: serine/threonine protein kinase [Myxococcales bacterium]|nr:serine/threonine protein kinase [Myxococcales bacterium]
MPQPADAPPPRLDPTTLVDGPRATLRPPPPEAQPAGALALLGQLQRDPAAALRDEGVLGEGGMGQVRLATQVALGRKVAVKTLRPDARGDHGTHSLLREAWVTGTLEHPNVVPVYDIGLDATGAPRIVLKRIEGEPWARFIGDDAGVRARFGVDDPLEWHLRTLMQVCTAVQFAHSRGILHRDLKPANVMVGAYGETYLVDWGVAVSLADDGSGRLPLARDAVHMAGTPVYMAPEMLQLEQGARLSERTDVYLLGGLLYEVLAHRPPHDAPTLDEIVQSVHRSAPVFPADAPPALEALARRAMAPDPADRPASAAEVRAELQRFLDRRPTTLLTAQAERRLAELTASLQAEGEDDRVSRYRLFGECRFGFRQALAAWPENQRARDGLRWAVRAMVEHELAHGDAAAASALLGELDAPAPDLRKRVEAAEAEARAARARVASLERLRADLDPLTGQRTRTFFMVVMGGIWTASPVARQWIDQGPPTYRTAIGGPLVFLAVAAGLTWWGRASMMRTAVNRRLLAAMFTCLAGLVVNDLVNRALGVPASVSLGQHIAVTGLTLTLIVATIDRRLWPAAAASWAAYALTGVLPDHVHLLMAVANGLLTINGIWVWRPDAWRRGTRAPRRADR